jgi:hypothetical protein
MDIKGAVTNIKAWTYIVVLLIAVATTAGTYAKIPERLNNLEATDNIHTSDIKSLSNAMREYLAVQAERDRWEEKHEERQMTLIDELRKSNGYH